MTDWYGNINWWGFSPALDLQEVGLEDVCKRLSCPEPDEVHILLAGAGDVRHILKTVARRYRHKHRKLVFYVTESALELYARQMLLLMVALELQANMGLQDKTELFLEIYGNSLVRQQSSTYVERMSHELIKMVTDFDYLAEKLPLFDLSHLKYKERDFLEGILKFWRNRQKIPFEISKCWDLRLRQLLGVRYDCRKNVYDWDYNMELLDRGGSVVYVQQYKEWRETGVAFQIREGTYDVPNRTLSSAMVFKLEGERFPRRGYWGDMAVSPYIAFGIETEEKSYYKKQNNMHVKTAEDISELNITSMFHELAVKQRYELPKTKPREREEATQETCTVEEITDEISENKKEQSEENGAREKSNEQTRLGPTEINSGDLLSPDPVETRKGQLNGESMRVETADSYSSAEQGQNISQNRSSHEVKPNHEWMLLEDVKVVFLPLACIQELIDKKKFLHFFHVVFFSNCMAHHLKPEVSQMFADRCSVILETALFMLQLKKDSVKEFVQKVSNLAKAAGCKPVETVNELQDSYMKFSFER